LFPAPWPDEGKNLEPCVEDVKGEDHRLAIMDMCFMGSLARAGTMAQLVTSSFLLQAHSPAKEKAWWPGRKIPMVPAAIGRRLRLRRSHRPGSGSASPASHPLKGWSK
jgi:hypothetical protein